jgi:hypothetical protein
MSRHGKCVSLFAGPLAHDQAVLWPWAECRTRHELCRLRICQCEHFFIKTVSLYNNHEIVLKGNAASAPLCIFESQQFNTIGCLTGQALEQPFLNWEGSVDRLQGLRELDGQNVRIYFR